MNRVLREEGLIVADAVLSESDFRSVCREVSHGDYKWVHAGKWDKAWRLWDGHPLRGQSVYYDPERRFGWKGASYPTSTAVDRLIDVIRETASSCPDVVGEEGVDWVALYLSPWLYPVGSALGLHRDGAAYSGAFTFFAHPRWSVHWGGELLVSRESSGPIPHGPDELFLPDDASDADDDCGDDRGIATCVAPRPNRLALIGPGRPHRVARVDANAGARVRASIAGFFLRRARA